MKNNKKSFRVGAGSTVDISGHGTSRAIKPKKAGLTKKTDNEKIAGDWKRVGAHISRAMRRVEKEA
jgi:hypothetical protein